MRDDHGQQPEIRLREPQPETTPPSQDRTLKEVREVKRWVQLGVSLLIIALTPMYVFLFQMGWGYVVINAVVGLALGSAIIEVAFRQILKLRLRTEQAMWESEQQVRRIIDSSLDAVIEVDEGGLITNWNPRAEELFGYRTDEAVGRELATTIFAPQQREAYERCLTARSGSVGPFTGGLTEIEALRRNGLEFPAELAVAPVHWNGITTYTAFLRDITDRKRAEDALRDRTTHDALTGVLNHGAIVDELRATVECEDCEHSIAMVDVDGLKATNDTYGHQVGDAVLKAVADGLAREDAVVGRYGGDEFVVLLKDIGHEGAVQYRRDVLKELSNTTVSGPGDITRIPIYVSVGLATYPEEADTVESWLSLADNGMYAARKAKSDAPVSSGGERVLGKERAARLVAEIVPLLTRSGTREDKLNLVAQHLSVSAGYDAINFEVLGDTPAEWQRAVVRAPKDIVDAWMHEQNSSQDHPLGRILEKTKRPVFIDDVATDEHLTENERTLLDSVGLKSGLVVPMIWQDKVVGMLSAGSTTAAAFNSWDAQFLTAVSSQVTAIVFMTTLVEELQEAANHLSQAHAETVMLLASVAEANDNTTGRHLQRVRSLTELLALELGYSQDEAREMGLAAVLHDIGKIQVPDAILNNPGSLSEQEWETMRRHTVWGANFLHGHKGFDLAEMVAHSHHERWDGGGYPRGIKGDEIPEAAAITTVADTFDAITNDRPYRRGRAAAEAIEEIMSCAGTQFSPRVAEALKRLHERGLLPAELDEKRQVAA